VSLPTIKLFLVESALVFEHIPTVLRGKVTNGQIDKVIVTFHPFSHKLRDLFVPSLGQWFALQTQFAATDFYQAA